MSREQDHNRDSISHEIEQTAINDSTGNSEQSTNEKQKTDKNTLQKIENNSEVSSQINIKELKEGVFYMNPPQNIFDLGQQTQLEKNEESDYQKQYSLFFDDQQQSRLETSLSINNVLIIYGGYEVDKLPHALSLACHFKKGQVDTRNITQFQFLDQKQVINFWSEIISPDTTDNSILIIPTSLSQGNEQVLNCINLVASKKSELTRLSKKLEEKKSQLIFVVDQAKNEPFTGQISKSLSHLVLPLSADQIRHYTLYRLEKLQADESLNDYQKETIDQISESLITQITYTRLNMSQVNQVIDEVNMRLKGDASPMVNSKDLKKIVQGVSNLTDWVSELSSQNEIWNRLMALSLCTSVYNEGISIIQYRFFFEKLQQYLSPQEPVNSVNQTPLQVQTDQLWLHRCRATKLDHLSTKGCVSINFLQNDYSERLWRIFLTDYSFLFAQLLPLVTSLIKDEVLTELAAKLFGRLCELDREQLRPIITRLSNSNSHYENTGVAHIYEGIWSSNNPHYIAYAEYLHEDLAKDADQISNFDRVWTYILIVSKSARRDSESALKKLKEVLTVVWITPLKSLKALDKKVIWHQNQLFTSITIEDLIEVGSASNEVETIERKLEQLSSIRTLIIQVISNMCFETNPHDVFSHLQKWISADDPITQKTFANLILGTDGLISQLSTTQKHYDQENKRYRKSIMIVSMITLSEESARNIAKFIQSFFPNHATMTSSERDHLKSQIMSCFEKWLIDIGTKKKKLHMLSVFFAFLVALGDDLGKRILESIKNCKSNSEFEAWQPIALRIKDRVKKETKYLKEKTKTELLKSLGMPKSN
ncbi:MAG: hypothetical protein HEP71_30040 [Roseivirga sp.]|nr:hypothetical protein [Roseivirga sp.]